jgi:hypothetical protein
VAVPESKVTAVQIMFMFTDYNRPLSVHNLIYRVRYRLILCDLRESKSLYEDGESGKLRNAKVRITALVLCLCLWISSRK